MTGLDALWYEALHSKYGIEVESSDRVKLRANLYEERKRLADPALDGLAVRLSPFDPDKLWLIKKDPNGQEA